MTNKTLDQLTGVTPPLVNTDLFAVLRNGAGTLTNVAWSTIVSGLQTAFSSIFLQISNNLSDLGSAATARTNLGLGSAALANYQPVKSVSGKVVDANFDVDVPFFRNRIINGDMTIDQRNAGASVTATAGTIYTVDRWYAQCSQASKCSVQQNLAGALALTGFPNTVGILATGSFSPAIGDFFRFAQAIEGFNTADLLWGTVNAKAVALSFWTYASLSGTYSGCLTNSAGSFSYPFSFSIPVPNVWTFITVLIPGSTAGVWNTTNGQGVRVIFDLGSGTNFVGSAGSWQAGLLTKTSGSTVLVANGTAKLYFTGVQLEAGASASTFERRPLTTELQFCQRYYENNFPYGTAVADGVITEQNVSSAYSATKARCAIKYSAQKRANPTVTFNGSSSVAGAQWAYWDNVSAFVAASATALGVGGVKQTHIDVTGTFTAGGTTLSTGGWSADAEL